MRIWVRVVSKRPSPSPFENECPTHGVSFGYNMWPTKSKAA